MLKDDQSAKRLTIMIPAEQAERLARHQVAEIDIFTVYLDGEPYISIQNLALSKHTLWIEPIMENYANSK